MILPYSLILLLVTLTSAASISQSTSSALLARNAKGGDGGNSGKGGSGGNSGKGGDNGNSGKGGDNGNDGKGGGAGACPSVWTSVSTLLTQQFAASGQCTGLARAAIRFAFHDSGTFSTKLPFYPPAAGGADGSLLLVPSEIGRAENGGLLDYYNFLTNVFNQFKSQGISAADLIQFAGAHAIVTCPGGPRVKTLVGRTDVLNNTASPNGLMPPGFGPGSDHNSLFALFQDKGFDAVDLAALVGAHTTSTALAQTANGIPVGGAQDDTPGIWDVDFYADTYNPPANVFRFQSDINLSQPNTTVGKEFQGFVNNQGKWQGKFADAMARLSILGIPAATVTNFVDCTNVLPAEQKAPSS